MPENEIPPVIRGIFIYAFLIIFLIFAYDTYAEETSFAFDVLNTASIAFQNSFLRSKGLCIRI